MKQKRVWMRILAFALIASMQLMMAACGSEETAYSQDVTNVKSGEGSHLLSSQTSMGAGDEVTVTDQLGRKITIKGKMKKIVSGYYITTSMMIALGLKDNLVGVEAKANSRPIYSLAAPEIIRLPNIGTAKDFDMEGCIALKPDLVILPIKLKDSIETLEKLGINVLAVNPENIELLKETITLIGKVTGTEERAAKLIRYYNDKLAEMARIIQKEQNKKTVYLAGNSDMLSTATSKMYQNTLIEIAGGKNVASGIDDTYWATVSYEQLIAFDPDIIIIVPFAQYTKDDVLAENKLNGLKAIQNKEVYKMPDSFEAWDSPVPSGILGTMWLISVLNEEEYPFDTFKTDAAAFYKEFYNIEINTDEITK